MTPRHRSLTADVTKPLTIWGQVAFVEYRSHVWRGYAAKAT
ncbi:hypothetical protein [Arsenophonus sp. PmNCSU2021_1]